MVERESNKKSLYWKNTIPWAVGTGAPSWPQFIWSFCKIWISASALAISIWICWMSWALLSEFCDWSKQFCCRFAHNWSLYAWNCAMSESTASLDGILLGGGEWTEPNTGLSDVSDGGGFIGCDDGAPKVGASSLGACKVGAFEVDAFRVGACKVGAVNVGNVGLFDVDVVPWLFECGVCEPTLLLFDPGDCWPPFLSIVPELVGVASRLILSCSEILKASES